MGKGQSKVTAPIENVNRQVNMPDESTSFINIHSTTLGHGLLSALFLVIIILLARYFYKKMIRRLHNSHFYPSPYTSTPCTRPFCSLASGGQSCTNQAHLPGFYPPFAALTPTRIQELPMAQPDDTYIMTSNARSHTTRGNRPAPSYKTTTSDAHLEC